MYGHIQYDVAPCGRDDSDSVKSAVDGEYGEIDARSSQEADSGVIQD